MPQVGAEYYADEHSGLDIMIVIGETGTGGRPTLSYCMQYALQYNLPPEKTFIDHGEEFAGWETTFTYLNPYSGADGAFYLPWEAVLDGSSMEYVYTSGEAPNSYFVALAAIDSLLLD